MSRAEERAVEEIAKLIAQDPHRSDLAERTREIEDRMRSGVAEKRKPYPFKRDAKNFLLGVAILGGLGLLMSGLGFVTHTLAPKIKNLASAVFAKAKTTEDVVREAKKNRKLRLEDLEQFDGWSCLGFYSRNGTIFWFKKNSADKNDEGIFFMVAEELEGTILCSGVSFGGSRKLEEITDSWHKYWRNFSFESAAAIWNLQYERPSRLIDLKEFHGWNVQYVTQNYWIVLFEKGDERRYVRVDVEVYWLVGRRHTFRDERLFNYFEFMRDVKRYRLSPTVEEYNTIEKELIEKGY